MRSGALMLMMEGSTGAGVSAARFWMTQVRSRGLWLPGRSCKLPGGPQPALICMVVSECASVYAQPRVQEVILTSPRTGDACEGRVAPVIIILIRIINISDGGREAV